MNKASFLKTLLLACILLISANSFSATNEEHPTDLAHGEEVTSNDYISHHLVFNTETVFSGEENGFWTLHLDSLFYSVFMALLFCASFTGLKDNVPQSTVNIISAPKLIRLLKLLTLGP